jgi:hypothetical protein
MTPEMVGTLKELRINNLQVDLQIPANILEVPFEEFEIVEDDLYLGYNPENDDDQDHEEREPSNQSNSD